MDSSKVECGSRRTSCVEDTLVAPPEKKQKSKSDKRERERRYWEEANASEGFDIDSDYGGHIPGGIVKMGENDDSIIEYAQFAVNEHNKNKENAFLELVRAVKGNIAVVAGFMIYVTLEAKDRAGETKTYQAMVWHKPDITYELTLFRLAPSKPPVTK